MLARDVAGQAPAEPENSHEISETLVMSAADDHRLPSSFRLRHVFSQRFCRMKVIFVLTMLALNAPADVCRVLIDGAGCGTRQLAIHKILEKMPGVEEVTILPRGEAPAANQRYFIVRSKGGSPTREELVEALGRRARHYRILSVTSVAEP
jgi:hypothetical protein